MNSSFTNIILSKDDFINCNWKEVVENSEEKTCEYYSRLFLKKYQEAEQHGNTQLQTTLAILTGITYPGLKPESREQPFYYMDFINKLRHEYLAVLKECISEIYDCELKSRIADVIWIRNKREYQMAQIAIDAGETHLNS